MCKVCGSDANANIHDEEPERNCKFPDEHHQFVAEENEE